MLNPELSIISACIIDNSIINSLIQKNLYAEMMGNYRHFWQAIVDKYSKGEEVDIVWAGEYAKNHNLVDRFSEAIASLVTPQDAYSSLAVLKERKLKVELLNIANAIRNHQDNPYILLETIKNKISLLEEKEETKTDVCAEVEKIYTNCQEIKIKTGFPRLDWIIKGITPQLIIVAGLSTHGKSLFSQNVAYTLAKNNFPVCYISPEMSVAQMYMRWAIMESEVNPVVRKLDISEKQLYFNALEKVKQYSVSILPTASYVEARLEVMKKKAILYIIDYLQLFYTDDSTHKTEYQRLDYIAKDLLTLSQMCEVCIIAVSQLNRGAIDEMRKERLKGSSQLEQSADTIILLHNPYEALALEEKEEYRRKYGDSTINLGVEKNRIYALTGFIKLHFNRKTLKIKELTEEVEQ